MKQQPKSIFTSKISFTSLHDQARASNPQQPVTRPSPTRQSPTNLVSGVGRETVDTSYNILEGTPTGQWKETPTEEGLKGASAVRNPLLEEASQRPPPQSHTPNGGREVPKTPTLVKRSRADTFEPRSEPLAKKPRHHIRPRHILDPATFPTGFSPNTSAPTSPLFFSHTPRQRPLPPTFSSSEAAATMLNRSREESGGVTTLKLARGSISSASPPRASSTPGSWVPLGRGGSTPRSLDSVSDSSATQILNGIGITDLLDQDERPTFIIDLANTANFSPGPLQVLYTNASLGAYDSILDLILGKADLDSPGIAVTAFPEFKAWVLSFVKNNESMDVCLPSFLYGGVTWACTTLKRRLRVFSGSTVTLPPRLSGSGSTTLSNSGVPQTSKSKLASSPLREQTEPLDYFGDAVNKLPDYSSPGVTESPLVDDKLISAPSGLRSNENSDNSHSAPTAMTLLYSNSTSSFDWTRLPLSSALPRHIQFARSIDWAATSLGPIESWSFDLRSMCNLVMGSPHPAAMYWGEDYVAIYNEAYVLLAGNKHPTLMGQSYKTAWAEIWDGIEDVFVSAKQSGQATMKDDDCLFIMRNGYLEESYFSWSIVPLVGEDGSVVGLYNPAFEKTRRKIAERRMLTLREVGERTAAAREVKGFWGQVIKGLEYNKYDVPFVFLYSVADEIDSDLSSMHSGSLSAAPQCTLEGSLGVPADHHTVQGSLDLRTSEQSWAPYLREAMKTDQPILLSIDDGNLSHLLHNLDFRGFGDPCRSVVVCPIHPTTGESILGFLVMGINPRRPYDDDYSLFIQLLSRQLATSMASVVLFEEEIRRGQRAARMAALDRIELSKQLDLRTQEVAESETKFTRMAEFSPVGMFIANSRGQITYSNETWWEITRHPKEENSADRWMDSVMDVDRDTVKTIWHKLIVDKIPATHEFRVKAPWNDRNGSRGDTWVLMNAYPEKDANGDLKSVFGSLTNISQQKYAEDFQKRRREEAVELKRQQENFIDITSHEMRNPLSAILQCADEITMTLSDYKVSDPSSSQRVNDVIDSSIDAAQTIALCAQHQKRIVDDVLTLSKLDSALLLVTPVDTQPIGVVQRALKMFEGELETNDINLKFQVEPSYTELQIDWVRLDPSRLLQVLINLTTNAIKFTHTQEKRTIIVSIGASKERPAESHMLGDYTPSATVSTSVSYFPSRSKRQEMTMGEDWGSGEEVYLHFAVQDTGRGLDENEKKLLFIRFSQASPRTHVQYGGSGLGLFISRELTELQGGEIGVASKRGVGSTFKFYVKARKSKGPANALPLSQSSILRKNSSGHAILFGTGSRSSAGRASQKMAQPAQQDPRPALQSRTSSAERSKLKVLIVEDNLVNQRVLQKQLNNLGCVTHVANHGGEALDILKTSVFWSGNETSGIDLTVILMDLEMPVMDGLTCARRIRELEADGTIVRHVPIIAVTANARLEQIETAILSGMDDVVSKPFRIPELIPKIEELIAKTNPLPVENLELEGLES